MIFGFAPLASVPRARPDGEWSRPYPPGTATTLKVGFGM